VITDYLIELIGELRVPRHRRRRIVAEVEDHLSSTAAELHASGLDVECAEREAVRRFGPASQLARAFVEQEAAVGGSRVARASGVLGVVLGALMLGPPGRIFEAQPFPHGLIDFVLGQVAFVVGVLTLLRGWRAAPDGGPAGVRLALVLRGAFVVIACAAVTVGHDAALAVTAPGAWLVLAPITAALVVTAATVARGYRLAVASCALAPAPGPGDDALADLETVALRLLGTRTPSRGAAWLRAHPWRLAVTVAVLAGVALAAAHGIGEGVSARHLRDAIVAGVIIAAIEAAAALTGFAVLGRFLAIRSR
jgi:hypothetical protein